MSTDMRHEDHPEKGAMEPHYMAAWRSSLEDPEAFWMEAAKAIDWEVAPRRAFDHHGLSQPQAFQAPS